jgi:hypothetical protein
MCGGTAAKYRNEHGLTSTSVYVDRHREPLAAAVAVTVTVSADGLTVE